jgi:arginase
MTTTEPRTLVLVEAPSNLGLREPAPGRQPGAWRAPEALRAAGLRDVLSPVETVSLERPVYSAAPQPGTRLLNGPAIRDFGDRLADVVAERLRTGAFPVVIGGDCSILLGCLAGARRLGEPGLVHIDGHADFVHPGNYDPGSRLGTVAGMDLALATGRGEALLTRWDGGEGPLVQDERVVQIGDREGRGPDTPYPDFQTSGIHSADIFWIREHGAPAAAERARRILAATPYWVHLDVDVLDAAVMPAVDSPGSPGLDHAELGEMLAALCSDDRCVGLDVTIFDPDQDPDGRHAAALVATLGCGLRRRAGAAVAVGSAKSSGEPFKGVAES